MRSVLVRESKPSESYVSGQARRTNFCTSFRNITEVLRYLNAQDCRREFTLKNPNIFRRSSITYLRQKILLSVT